MQKQSQSITMKDIHLFNNIDKEIDWTKPVDRDVRVLFERIVAAKTKYYEAVMQKCTQENERRQK